MVGSGTKKGRLLHGGSVASPQPWSSSLGTEHLSHEKCLGKAFIQQIAWLKEKFRGWNMVKHDETWVGNGWDWLMGDTLDFASSFSSYNKNIGELTWWSTHGSAMLILSNRTCWKWEEGKKHFLRVWELVEGEGCRQKTASKYDWHKATRFFSRPTGQVLASWMLAGTWMSMLSAPQILVVQHGYQGKKTTILGWFITYIN